MKRDAFTMIELVFVIVILGILAGIAIPRLAASREDAQIVKAASDVSAIRSSVVTKASADLLQGKRGYPDLEGADTTKVFDNVLMYPIIPGTKSGQWSVVTDNEKYTIHIDSKSVIFSYNKTAGIFTCDHLDATTGNMCKSITK